jgi:hypothetical protein
MAKYLKRPVEIEARELVYDNAPSIAEWCGGELEGRASVVIHTLEGDLRADPGDFVICGVKGEFYPCKPDVFAATYDADDAPRSEGARAKCVIGEYCRRHQFVHGAEAEELRKRIEGLIGRGSVNRSNALQDVLDEVDARDSLAFLEAREKGGA